MSLLEQNSLLSKLIDIGSLCLRMSAEAANPIIQIVDGDEQNVGLVDRTVGIGPFVRLTESEKECNRREDQKSRRS